MPVLWEWRDSVLLVTTIGDYPNQDLMTALEEMSVHSRFVRGTPLVFDARQSKAQLSKSDVDWRVGQLAAWLERSGFGPKMAFVLGSDEPHRYGIARMVQMLSEMKGFQVEIFRDVEDALTWARISESTLGT